MLELTATWARWSKLAALSIPLLLGAGALVAHRALGAPTAFAVVALSSVSFLAALLLVTRQHLRRTRARARLTELALDAVPHALFVAAAERPGSPNVYVNAAYTKLTGYSASEAVAVGFDAFGVFVDGVDASAPGKGSETRGVVRRRDGSTFTARVALFTVANGDDGRFVIGTIEDVSAGERVGDRKPAARAEVTDSAAVSPERARDAFLSWLSHELRSPLNACVMWLDVLALAPQPDKVAKAADAIKRNLARQTKLVNDLNAAAKIASSNIDLNLQTVDVAELLRGSIDAWQLTAIGKDVTLEHSFDGDVVRVLGDPERLTQTLSHLVDAAIASTPAGGRVTLRLYCRGDDAIVEVEDTGAAITPEEAANLGTPLWRAPTTAKARSGLGLGLAIAHHIAMQHGGTLTAAPADAGARLVLTLPLAPKRQA